MRENIADIVVKFIRTQEEVDRINKKCELVLHKNEAAQCRRKAERLQRKADRLLAKYQSVKRTRQVRS